VSIEDNKALVTRTWEMLLGGDVERALANFSDDITWWITGTLDGVSGVKKGKPQVSAFFAGVTSVFPGGLKSEIQNVHADGDTVIVECVNRGTAMTGKPYENEYCFVFEVAGGKIHAIREYVDLDKARLALRS
jgi:hypothetical protein